MLTRGDRLYTSAPAVGEILVGTVESGNLDLMRRYQAYFSRAGVQVLPFDRKAASCYAKIRQDRSIQRPDAIHLACAAAEEMDLFITNDDRLSRKVVDGISFISSLEAAPL